MTRKDFEFIAGVIRTLDSSVRVEVAEKFARMCAGENSGFKFPRFYKACGVNVTVTGQSV